MNRKKQLLAVLLFVLAGAIVFSVMRFPRQQRVGTVPQKGAPAAARPPAAGAPTKNRTVASAAVGEERLRLDLFNREQAGDTASRRNIFSPIFRDEVKAPPFRPLPPPPKPLPLPPRTQPAPVTQQVAPPPPAPPAPPPMPNFTFLGFLKQKGGQQRVFIAMENQIYVVKQGSVIGGDYEVTSLTDDAITIAARTGVGETVIPLVENRGLTPRSGRRAP